MKLSIIDQNGKETATKVDLSKKVFGIEPNDHAIWLDVKYIRANARQGTHQTKGRSYVSGGGKKPFRQKGTGRARQGTIRAPHHVGGGRVFGPEPRTYKSKLNKKVKLLARRSALSYKAKDQKIIIVENFNYEKPSTKGIRDFVTNLELSGKNVLFCTSGNAPEIVKSTANLYNIQVRDSITFSTYDVLKADTIVLQEGALQKINEVLGK